MRFCLAALTVVAAISASLPARAENHVFIVASHADGYGVDRCLATGAHCGETVATAYCHARAFERAVSFRKVARDAVTGTIAAAAANCAGSCKDYVAIECGR